MTADELAAFHAEVYRRGQALTKEAAALGVLPLYLSIAVGMRLEGVIPTLRLVEPSQGRPGGRLAAETTANSRNVPVSAAL